MNDWLHVLQMNPPKQEKKSDSTTPVHQTAQKIDLPPTVSILPPNAGWALSSSVQIIYRIDFISKFSHVLFIRHCKCFIIMNPFTQQRCFISWWILLRNREEDDVFDYMEDMDSRPLTQEELRSAIINKVTRKSTCQRLYIRRTRSQKQQWNYILIKGARKVKSILQFVTIVLQNKIQKEFSCRIYICRLVGCLFIQLLPTAPKMRLFSPSPSVAHLR